MPHLVVFGAGPAVGLSTARRFAAEGYGVTLVARRPDSVAGLEASLRDAAGPGAVVDSVLADLTDRGAALDALAEAGKRHGTPDAVLYSPGDVARLPVAALGLDAGTLESWLPLNLLTPVAIVHAVLPGMLARGSGAILVAQGATARQPMPDLASSAVPQAGLLAYLHSVSLVAAPGGVYVGSLLIGALVERSAAADLFDGGHFDGLDAGDIRRVDPDVIAERFWRMARDRSPVETAVP